MFGSFWEALFDVLTTSIIIIIIWLSTIVIGIRFGLFLWIFKRLLRLRSWYLHRKLAAREEAHHED